MGSSSLIQWLGSSPHWPDPPRPLAPRFLFSLIEESSNAPTATPCSALPRNRPRRHLSPPPALLPPDLSPGLRSPGPFPAPSSRPLPPAPTPASLFSQPVNTSRAPLRPHASCGVLEEFIPGPQFEWDARLGPNPHLPPAPPDLERRLVSYHRVPVPVCATLSPELLTQSGRRSLLR